MTSGASPHILPTGAWTGATAAPNHSWSPQLAAWIGDALRGEEDVPVNDLGCGLGHYLQALRARGFEKVRGVEAELPNDSVLPWSHYLAHDLTRPFSDAPGDAVEPGNTVCLEVAEHVPAYWEDVLLKNVAKATASGKMLVLSWALRGQGGAGHVNEKDNPEVVDAVQRHGFLVHLPLTVSARAVIRSECPWFKQTLLVFRRK